MDDKQKLLQLIKMMKVPFSDKEVVEFVNKLSTESIEKLTSIYEEIKKFEDNLDYVVKNTDPVTYEKIKEEYSQKLLVLQEEFIRSAEEIQKRSDDQLDAEEIKSGKKIDESTSILMKEVDEIQNQHDSLCQFINQKLSTP